MLAGLDIWHTAVVPNRPAGKAQTLIIHVVRGEALEALTGLLSLADLYPCRIVGTWFLRVRQGER